VSRYGPLMVRKTAAIAVSPRCTDLIKVALTRHGAVRQGSPTFKNHFKRTSDALPPYVGMSGFTPFGPEFPGRTVPPMLND
jgi:hypothetical protein